MNNIVETQNRSDPAQKIAVLFFLPAVTFAVAAWVFGTRAAGVFRLPMLAAAHPLPLILLFIVCLSLTVFHGLLPIWLRKDVPGILLAALFFLGYLILASIFNHPSLNTNNIFFAADSGSWQARLVSEEFELYASRAVHPFPFLILRPLVWIISFLTGGDNFFAGLILVSSAGAASVYLAWKLLGEYCPEAYYPFGFASLLGLSSAHLMFSSIFETYVFSALFLILFSLFALNQSRPVWIFLIPASVLTLGITVSNFGQNMITLFFTHQKSRIWTTLFVLGSVIVLAALLNFVNNQVYASSVYFFNPGDFSGESRNIQAPERNHIILLTQDMFVFNISAPQPHFHGQNLRLRFNFDTDGFDYFIPVGRLAVIGWLLLLCIAVWQFIRSMKPGGELTRFSLAMLACLGFNYLLHFVYGFEPFLYTTDWTYALVLFVAFNLHFLAEKIWFKIGFLAFLGFLLLNNGWFLYFMITLVEKNFTVVF
jgi:hypothetical protein